MTEKELLDLGFKLVPSPITDSYTLNVSFMPEFEYKELSVTIQPGNQYMFIRQGSVEQDMYKDDLVTLFNSDSQGELTIDIVKRMVDVLTVNNRPK